MSKRQGRRRRGQKLSPQSPPQSNSIQDFLKSFEFAFFTVGGFVIGAFQIAGVAVMELTAYLFTAVGVYIVTRVSLSRWSATKDLHKTGLAALVSLVGVAVVFGGSFFWIKGKKTEIDKKTDNQNERFEQLEFNSAIRNRLSDIGVQIGLNGEYSKYELGHFRILLTYTRSPHVIEFALGCDNYVGGNDKPVITRTVWTRPRAGGELHSEDGGTAMGNFVNVDRAACFYSPLGASPDFPYHTLEDLDHKLITLYVTSNLAAKIKWVKITGNDYALRFAEDEDVRLSIENPEIDWPRRVFKDHSDNWREVKPAVDPVIEEMAKDVLFPNTDYGEHWQTLFDTWVPRRIGYELSKPLYLDLPDIKVTEADKK